MKRMINEFEMAKRVDKFILETYQKRSLAAIEWDITRDMIDKICRGDRPPSEAVLKDMGYTCEKTITVRYRKI